MPLPETDGAASDDIRASLSAAFDEADKTETPADPIKSDDVEVIEETVDESSETPEQKAGRLAGRKRDEHGKLLPGKAEKKDEKKDEKVELKDSEVKAEDKKLPSEDNQTKVSADASKQTDAPPAGWTADAKAEWSKLSPALKAAVLKRESEIENGGRQWSDEKRRYESVLSPIAQAAQRRGLDVGQGVQMLVAAQNALDANPVEGIKRIAQTYGVNLATIAGSASAESSNVNNPQANPSQTDISELVRQAVAPLLAPIQERYANEERSKAQNTESLVSDFSTKNEHYKSLEPEIELLIPHIWKSNPNFSQQQVLQEAYDRAVYANPHTRAAILASQNADADAKRRAEAQAKANKARTAATSLTGSSVIGAGQDGPKDSLRAELEAAFSQTG